MNFDVKLEFIYVRNVDTF